MSVSSADGCIVWDTLAVGGLPSPLTLSFPSRDTLPAGDANLRSERFPVPTKVLDSKLDSSLLDVVNVGRVEFDSSDVLMSGCTTLLFATAAAECPRGA